LGFGSARRANRIFGVFYESSRACLVVPSPLNRLTGSNI
jgi:hypothetical protein